MIKAIIFDFFDVIWSDPYNAWLKNHGYVRERRFLEASQKVDGGQINMDQFFALLSSLSGQPATSIEREFESTSGVNQEVLAIVDTLRKHYKVGLLSNAPSKFIRGILQDNNLERFFDEIVISSEVGYIKPEQEIFRITLDSLSTQPSETLFIDDSKHHIEGAEKANIRSIQFFSAAQLSEELKKVGVTGVELL
jgi:putative hydrolase of the HAD superfamily